MSDRRGFTLWFTGLSGRRQDDHRRASSAPSSSGAALLVEYLDGDVVRTHLSKGLGFSKEDRDTNIGRIGWVASRFTRAGVGDARLGHLALRRDARRGPRRWSRSSAPFVEVFVDTSVEECAKRDVKGLYAKAFSGEIKEFTGRQRPLRGAREPRGPHRHRVARRPRRARRW